ncbi:MAG: GTP-binding protein [Lachnospiraceae bacterium]|nr:GTP-binding protein [Lachnospiraceae bacterium]
MTKIDIISGFLGAGKTTLIKKLIQESLGNEKLVLIENEFGEIGIDGGFLKEAGVQVTEMNSGCICCSLVGDFGKSLQEVLSTYAPDRVIIEPSGVGKLSDVIKAVQGVNQNVEICLNSTTAVVDATKAAMYMKNFGEFFNNQIESARTIVLSRTQNMSMEKLDKCVSALKEHNEKAVIITTPWDNLEGVQILKAMEQEHSLLEEMMGEEEICPECGHHHHHGHEHHHSDEHLHHEDDHHHEGECCGHEHHHHHGDECCGQEHHHHEEECCGHEHHHHHHADDVFTSWGIETPHKFSEDSLKEILNELANNNQYGVILRAKGILPAEGGQWLHFDLVPGEYEVRNGAADITGRLCVIGTDLNTEKIQELFGV